MIILKFPQEKRMNNTQNSMGAVYQLSNSSNNSVLMYNISKDGNLQFFGSVNTGGSGTSLNMPDPLLSQNPIVVYDNYLFAVNPGSNNLSIFSINPSDPTDVKLLNVVDTDGDYPVSIAVNSDTIAVLNGGTRSNLRCFTWDQSGAINMIPSFSRNISLKPRQSTPPKGPPNTVSDVAFSPDNKCLLISYKGSDMNNPGAISIYTIKNGQLSTKPIKNILNGGFLPFGMKTAGNNGLIVTNASNGVNYIVYNSSTGMTNASSSNILPIGGAVCWVTYSPLTKNYYVVGATSNDITELTVNNSSLQSVNTYHLPTGSNPGDSNVAAMGSKNYLYVNSPGTKSINVLELTSAGTAKITNNVNYPPSYSSPAVVGLAIKMNDFGTTAISSSLLPSNAWIWLIILLIIIVIIYIYMSKM